MEDEVEYSGKTVEDAIAQAESNLGTEREQLQIEVVSQGSRGVFGIGAEPARIRVKRPTDAAAERARSDEEAVVAAGVERSAAVETLTVVEAAPGRAAQNGSDLADEATEVLRQILRSMKIQADVSIESTESPITLAVHGDNLGILIGRRGDNLSALQFMVNLILSKNRRQWPRVVLDVENYRARREESLRTLADRIAYRVRRNGRPFTLEAMPASDRRIIHLALRDRADVETYSIGEGPARRVVVAPKRAERAGAPREY